MDKCEKCGGDDLATRFVENGKLIDFSSSRAINDEFVESSEYDFYYKITAKKEHLNKHCRNCQFSWRENTVINRADKP